MITCLRNILIGLFVSCCFSSSAFSAGQKLLVVAEDFPPFEYIDNKGQVVGIDVDIARHIFNKMNIDFEVRVLPWKSAWKMIETGKADAVMTTSRKDKRKPFLYYPKEDMWTSKFVFL